MKHVILGAGPAGVIAAETIRKHAPHDEILIVGDEPEPPYSRMAIPYLLIGNVGEDGTHLRHGADHYAKLRIDVRRGVRATGVDTKARTVALDDGGTVPFDRLLIATGSRPASPPIPGIHSDGVHTCWTLQDARAIMQRASQGARVLQMGAGFIGCIIMEALAARGVQLTVVEMGDRMVPRMMGPTAGGMIKDWCEAKGVRVVTGARVEAIEPHAPLRARLSTGDFLEADLVISATGVKPAIGFLENSEIRCLLGVLTDEHMQTTVPGIYAAGDCAEAFDPIAGKTIVSAIQPNAADQARVAALNMVGRKTALKMVTQINVLDTLGLISSSFGDWQGVPGGEHVELTDRAAGRHLSLQFQGDRLIGCNSIGWTEHVGVMRGLVEGQVSLGEWKDKLLADPTRLAEAYLARAQAQEARALVKA
ncbi:MAG: FAD-dependent oxidoreductase [Burkholderiaceae bacterium]|jgi:NADPH-dependent 2,4-dienoyl-CoA reductase/sulfur reductase-like enzyme|nr:FAD-dependent oxidoreductase [Burkholderiaceae bacterium]MCU0928593.1 FAD-dependent oxidoreductase [Burkholderiaceae bacterium]